jgi:Tfp pilus assembly protein PilF
VKATALAYLEPPLTPGAIDAVQQALNDPNPLVRIGALSSLDGFALSDIAQLVFPLVEDDVKAVRIQAARLLAPMLQQKIAGGGVKLLKAVIQEYIDTQRFSAERPESQLNLGAVYSDIGQLGQAEAAYQQALVLQPKFVPAYVNLAQLYARTQQQAKAISLLEQGIQQVADSAALHHALGLALVRNKQSERALRELSRAAGLDSDNARFAYVYAIALHSAGETAKAINVLESNHGKHPGNIDTLMALVTINRDAGNPDEAWRYLEVLKKLLPNNPAITRLESQLSR